MRIKAKIKGMISREDARRFNIYLFSAKPIRIHDMIIYLKIDT